MKDGHYVSIICKTREGAEDNYFKLRDAFPGIDIVEGLPGNELLIHCQSGSGFSLNQIRETVKGPARIDQFELATDEKSGQQYRNWYYLPPRSLRRKTTG